MYILCYYCITLKGMFRCVKRKTVASRPATVSSSRLIHHEPPRMFDVEFIRNRYGRPQVKQQCWCRWVDVLDGSEKMATQTLGAGLGGHRNLIVVTFKGHVYAQHIRTSYRLFVFKAFSPGLCDTEGGCLILRKTKDVRNRNTKDTRRCELRDFNVIS